MKLSSSWLFGNSGSFQSLFCWPPGPQDHLRDGSSVTIMCRFHLQGGGRKKAHWDVFCSPDSEVVHFIVTHAIGDNVVTWPQLTARDAGKCSPSLSSHVPDYSSLIIEEWFSTNNWSSELESSEEPFLFPTSLSGWCSLLQTVCSKAAIAAVSYHSAFPIPLLPSGLWTQWVLLCILIAWHLLDNEHILSKSMEDQLLNLQGPVQCRVPFSKRIRILRKRHQELLWQFSG